MNFSPELLDEVNKLIQSGSGKIVLGQNQSTTEGFGPLSSPLSKFLAFVPGPDFNGNLDDLAALLKGESYGYIQQITPDQLKEADIAADGPLKSGVLLAAKEG